MAIIVPKVATTSWLQWATTFLLNKIFTFNLCFVFAQVIIVWHYNLIDLKHWKRKKNYEAIRMQVLLYNTVSQHKKKQQKKQKTEGYCFTDSLQPPTETHESLRWLFDVRKQWYFTCSFLFKKAYVGFVKFYLNFEEQDGIVWTHVSDRMENLGIDFKVPHRRAKK